MLGRYRSVVPFVSDMRAFLNSFKSSKNISRKSITLQPSEEVSVSSKKRRFAVSPPIESKDSSSSTRKSASLKNDKNEAEVARENMEVLLEFFNDRLVAHLAIL